MKLTLDNVVERINQVLNYPSVAYTDISHFFDHAMAELNTILKIAIPSVSDLVSKHSIDTTVQNNTVLLESYPNGTVHRFEELPTGRPAEGEPTYGYFVKPDIYEGVFYIYNGRTWNEFESMFGVLFENAEKKVFVATPVGQNAYWTATEVNLTLEFDLCEYMPADWWTLFVIPYVCFKYAVRDGDDGALYSTEFTQGLQQLQTSYDVPNSVVLSTVAHLPAYKEDVSSNINSLGKRVITKAITEDMRVGNAISAIFGNMHDRGGWGI